MTITEAPPETTTAPASDTPEPATGLEYLVTTGDHKSLGSLYARVSLLFGVVFTVLGVGVAVERTDTGGIDLYYSFDQFVQWWQAYSIGVIFLVVVPLFIGLATSIVPLQLGSPAIAFPRAAAAAFWGWLIGSGLLLASFIADGGFGTPGGLADPEPTLLSILAFALVLLSIGLASVCLATSVVALRPLGMKLHRVPVFSWSILVAASFWILGAAVLLGNLVYLYVQFRYLAGEPAAGTAGALEFQPGMWDQLSWAFTGPQVFAWIIPLLGVAAEVVPVATRLRQKSYTTLLGAIAAFGLLSFAGYAQPYFDSGDLSVTEQAIYVAQSVLLVIPVLVLFGGLADSLRLGGRRVGAPRTWLIAPLLGLLVLLVGVAFTAMRGIDEFDLVGTSADAALLHLALGAGLLGGIGGLALWTPKLLGRKLTSVSLLGALAVAGGALVAGVPDFVSGLLDQPLLAGPGYVAQDGVEAFNIVSMIGSVLLALGVLAVLADVAVAVVRGADDKADPDPWGGHTLEWSTTSPPPATNFAEPVDMVVSERPLLDTAATPQEES